MSQHSKNKIQKEIEELSWAFMAESTEPKKEKYIVDNMEEESFLSEANETAIESFDDDNSEQTVDDGLQSFYANNNHDYGLNDMGRNSGIMMDEDKLKSQKITKWHRPNKTRESKFKIFLKAGWWLITWPIRISIWSVISLSRNSYLITTKVVKALVKLFSNIVILSLEFILAFKYVWVYLFGESRVSTYHKKKENVIYVRKQSQNITWRKVAVFLVLAILMVVPFQVYMIYHQAISIKGKVLGATKQGLSHFKQARIAGTNFDFNKASNEFNLAEEYFSIIENNINQLGIVSSKLGKFIPDIQTGKKLVKVAVLISQVGEHVAEAASWLDKASNDLHLATSTGNNDVVNKRNGNIITDKIEIVSDTKSLNKVNLVQADYEMNLAVVRTQQVVEILKNLKLKGTQFAIYNDEFNGLKNNLPLLLNWLKTGHNVTSILRYVLGVDEPRRWMLIFQNNAELRPTGGFMGSYAILDIKDANIENIDVPGGGFYDLKGSLTVKVDTPYPFHLFSPIWQPWNANWFYDWPTSAKKIEWFYNKSGGSSVDGVIAFTPNILVDLLKIVGQVEMPNYGVTINSDNFIREAQMQVEFKYDKIKNNPKKFIGDLLPKILEKLSMIKRDQSAAVLQLIINNFKEKHLLIYLNNQKLQNKIEQLGWAGAVKPSSDDYLAVIHTNVAGGKTDGVITTTIKHEVEILADGSTVDTVTVNKKHNGKLGDVFEDHVNTDYIRFYVPQGSKLLAAQGFDPMPIGRIFQKDLDTSNDKDLEKVAKTLKIDLKTNTRITDEFGKTVFANWMIVAPGKSKEVVIKYLLPTKYKIGSDSKINTSHENFWQLLERYFWGARKITSVNDTKTYNLVFQKQPGSNGDGFVSSLKLDSNWSIVNYQPKDNIFLSSQGIKFKNNLITDGYYQLTFKH